MGFFDSLFGSDSGKATMAAAQQNRDLLGGLKTEGLGYIDAGTAQAKPYLQSAVDAYSPLASLGQQGSTMYANALGLNGASGNQAATAAFQQAPGYQFQLGQGLDALQRTAASQGRLQSGQTGIDTMTYAQGLANQGYNSWLGNLSGYNGMLGTAAAGQATGNTNLANLYQNQTGQQLNLSGSVASGLMGANNQYAQGAEAQSAAKTKALGDIVGLGAKLFTGYGGF